MLIRLVFNYATFYVSTLGNLTTEHLSLDMQLPRPVVRCKVPAMQLRAAKNDLQVPTLWWVWPSLSQQAAATPRTAARHSIAPSWSLR